jgi:Sulfotransferase family
LLHLALPRARFIHCRRHPVDTCLSIFFESFGAVEGYASDRGDLVFAYRQYERLMDHWRRVLPPGRFTEVRYETLVANREAETRRLVEFCGLDWDDACLAPERNARVVKTASMWQARQPVYATSVERWRRYEPWLGDLRELAPEA